MQPVPQDLLKDYVQSRHLTCATEIMTAMKELFWDVIQTVIEVEMGEKFGRERCERSDKPEPIQKLPQQLYEKGVKTQLGELLPVKRTVKKYKDFPASSHVCCCPFVSAQ